MNMHAGHHHHKKPSAPLDAAETLKKAGLKLTPSRIAALDAFSHACCPLGADELIGMKGLKGSDSATIYRTISAFEDAGIIRRIDLGKAYKDSSRYELAGRISGNHHHHMICESCGAIEDFKKCIAEDISSLALSASSLFSRIDDHSLELFGQCKKCATHQSA